MTSELLIYKPGELLSGFRIISEADAVREAGDMLAPKTGGAVVSIGSAGIGEPYVTFAGAAPDMFTYFRVSPARSLSELVDDSMTTAAQLMYALSPDTMPPAASARVSESFKQKLLKAEDQKFLDMVSASSPSAWTECSAANVQHDFRRGDIWENKAGGYAPRRKIITILRFPDGVPAAFIWVPCLVGVTPRADFIFGSLCTVPEWLKAMQIRVHKGT